MLKQVTRLKINLDLEILSFKLHYLTFFINSVAEAG